MKKELLNYLKSVQSLESDLYAYECSKEEIQNRINDTKYEIESIEEPHLVLPSEPQKPYVEDLDNRILRIKKNSMFYGQWVHKSGLFWGILVFIFCSVLVCVLTMATMAEGSLDDEDQLIVVFSSFVLTIVLGYLPARWIGVARMKKDDINCAKKLLMRKYCVPITNTIKRIMNIKANAEKLKKSLTIKKQKTSKRNKNFQTELCLYRIHWKVSK